MWGLPCTAADAALCVILLRKLGQWELVLAAVCLLCNNDIGHFASCAQWPLSNIVLGTLEYCMQTAFCVSSAIVLDLHSSRLEKGNIDGAVFWLWRHLVEFPGVLEWIFFVLQLKSICFFKLAICRM